MASAKKTAGSKEDSSSNIFSNVLAIFIIMLITGWLLFLVLISGGVSGLVRSITPLPDFDSGEPLRARTEFYDGLANPLRSEFNSRFGEPIFYGAKDTCERNTYDYKVKIPELAQCSVFTASLYLAEANTKHTVSEITKDFSYLGEPTKSTPEITYFRQHNLDTLRSDYAVDFHSPGNPSIAVTVHDGRHYIDQVEQDQLTKSSFRVYGEFACSLPYPYCEATPNDNSVFDWLEELTEKKDYSLIMVEADSTNYYFE